MRRNDFDQGEVFDLDDHKDALRDASHFVRYGTGGAVAGNLARCYLQLRRHRAKLVADMLEKARRTREMSSDPAALYVADTLEQVAYELKRFPDG